MRFPSIAAVTAVLFAAIGSVQGQKAGTTTPQTGPLGQAYPFKCADWCGPVITVSQNVCDKHSYDCFCDKPHMKHLIPLCEACTYNARNVGNGIAFYPLIKETLETCNFKTTSVTQGAAAATAAPVMAVGGLAAMLAMAAL